MKTVYQEQTDEELIARIRSGERGVTEYLLEKYKPLVKKQARTMYLMGGENEDLIQEGMIGLFRAISTYRPGGWIFLWVCPHVYQPANVYGSAGVCPEET